MRFFKVTAVIGLILSLPIFPAAAADFPAPQQGVWIAKSFRFHTDEIMPELRLHYTTIGDPAGQKVLLLHGTGGSAASFLTPAFAGELFGPGQPLDAKKYFIIMPDSIGAGGSSKPSDSLRMAFPKYDYNDMVLAQYRLVTEGLGIHHLRLVLGNSMGGMHTWLWGETWPDFMDALAPMASQPTPMASRNWMLRRLLVEMVRNDPAWKGGNYTTEPPSLHIANAFFGVATSGGTLAWQKQAPTREAADRLVDGLLAAPATQDANDFIYQWDSSGDYTAMAGLDRIKARLLAINSADDERNPPETGLLEAALKQVRSGSLYLIPASENTRGHGTTGMARFWKDQLQKLLESTP